MTDGLDLDDTHRLIDNDVVEHPEVLDPELPIGQFALT